MDFEIPEALIHPLLAMIEPDSLSASSARANCSSAGAPSVEIPSSNTSLPDVCTSTAARPSPSNGPLRFATSHSSARNWSLARARAHLH